jgi:hypothetical protein
MLLSVEIISLNYINTYSTQTNQYRCYVLRSPISSKYQIILSCNKKDTYVFTTRVMAPSTVHTCIESDGRIISVKRIRNNVEVVVA